MASKSTILTVTDELCWILRASLIAISEDGVISEDERPAFQDILDSLEKISTNAKALKRWAIKNIHIQEEDV